MNSADQSNNDDHPAEHLFASETASYYEQIFQSFSSGVIVLNKNARVILSNQAACHHLGISDQKLHAGANFELLPGVEAFLEVFREMKLSRKPVSRREIIIEKGAKKRIIGTTASLLDGAEPFNGVIFLFIDLTQMRRQERAAALNRQLAQIGKLTAGVVHELRNPLSVISGMAELLMRKLGDEHELHHFAATIFEEAHQMENLVGHFLSFAKPFDMDFGRVEARSVVDRAHHMAETQAAEKHIQLQVNVLDGSSHLRADLEKVALAVYNLLLNAIDAVKEGGQIELACLEDGDNVIFCVTDNGPGINIAESESLLNPFYSKKAEGTGLGLSITHRVVTAHGGHLSYGNREQGGAWFEISLPKEKLYETIPEPADELE